MLVLSPKDVFTKNSIVLKNKRNGKPCFSKAYSLCDSAEFLLYVEKTLGVFHPKLVVYADGTAFEKTLEFEYLESRDMTDTYILNFDISDICKEAHLLFFYVSFSVGDNDMYFVSRNNVDGILVYPDQKDKYEHFKMLVYKGGYETPRWFCEGVMYHIFVDRFNIGSVPVPKRENAIINDDWYNGIPQYGNMPGDFCANNMFFGGTLYGICEKLDYLVSLGVKIIYLSPVFEAYSNHKYDTADYSKVDEMFGGERAFKMLVDEAKNRGIRVIIDGVFNHTGDDSIYFNKRGSYGTGGAFNDKNSKYYKWYKFNDTKIGYDCWWGIDVLPKLDTENKEVVSFLAGDDGVAAKRIRGGVSGVRLDVADELPDKFLDTLRVSLKNADKDCVIIGEVWENAADKVAYNKRRSYFQGGQLDGVMNYPIKNAIVDYVNGGNSGVIYDTVCDIYSSYPPQSANCLMNLLGTHDTERILTVLGTQRHKNLDGNALSVFKMTEKEYENGVQKLFLASVLQYTLPGCPSVFYGDEAGICGGRDPFCRKPFPWGKEDKIILSHYKKLGEIRNGLSALSDGEIKIEQANGPLFVFSRIKDDQTITVAVNVSDTPYVFDIHEEFENIYSVNVDFSDKGIVLNSKAFAVLKKKV